MILGWITATGCLRSSDQVSQGPDNIQQEAKSNLTQNLPGFSEGLCEINDLTYVDTTRSYTRIKQEIEEVRSTISKNQLTADSISSLVTHLLVRKIIPYWYGTKWSFDGHTAEPGKGTVACGYFVSTTLRDLGFNLNRFEFAQQLPRHEALTLVDSSRLIEFAGESAKEIIQRMKDSLPEGIYFIGFANKHTGFLYVKGGHLCVIHSNYVKSRGVEIEMAEESIAFKRCRRFYIAAISTNKSLIDKWLRGEEIEIFVE